MSTPEPLEPLDAQILQQFATSDFLGLKQTYMPDGCLDQLITKDSIIREFSRDDEPGEEPHVDDDLINFILQSAKKVFAISIWSDVGSRQLLKAMKIFKYNAFGDSRLPILDSDLKPDKVPWSQLKWNVVKLDHFKDSQWKFLIPVFSQENIRLELENRHILPLKVVPRDLKTGAFSDVYEVTIHKSHQKNPMEKFDKSPANAAIKVIKPSDPKSEAEAIKEWEREARALEETRDLRHDHIIDVKAICTWKGKGNFFMFQWADGGSLRELYKSLQRPTLDKDLIKDIIKQLMGLAQALERLHNWKENGEDAGSYRHGDLKPENILRFENNTRIGFLKIADMGLAKHHFDKTGYRGPTTTRYGTPLYEPPEAFLNPNDARSRQYDIWSMGCVILEIIVWLLYGNKELESFNESLNQIFKNTSPYWAWDERSRTVKIHPHVQACIDHIGKDPECKGSTAIGDLLNIVKTKLIVVPLPPPTPSSGTHNTQMPAGRGGSPPTTHPSGHSRAKAEEFYDALKKILKKGRDNNKYWLTGTPRDDLPGPVNSMPSVPMASSSEDVNVPTIKASGNTTIKPQNGGGKGANERKDVS